MNKKMNLSIVIPVLNEGNNIRLLSNKIIQCVKKIDYEIIFVDDNSIDESQKILSGLKKNINFLILFSVKKKEILPNLALME